MLSAFTEFAIVGLAVRLPGATDVDAYWQNLRGGLSAIRKLSEDDLVAAGVSKSRLSRSDYVPFAAPLDGFADFDPEFFGLSPKEAAIMDPQHRQFLEVAWEAMETAGHPPESLNGQIGVYAGCGMGSYFYFNVCSHRDLVNDTGMFLLRHTGNDKDFMATRASHAFDLKGPALGIQTACSTSLVAIHYATQALAAGDCEMALAGGVTIEMPQGQGYVFKQDEILSPDGACRAFDAKAEGTVFGSGAGVVAIRRLDDAIADGDHIWAVIKGSAVNNDGAMKASYLAPSVEGQTNAIVKAHEAAGISAKTVGYVECHGTGTYLGDPIEVEALSEAFRHSTDATDFCKIGSVKTNIGHLDTAAGVASLVKASLALYHKEIPPSLNFETPNPDIAFEGSPFRVNAELTPWADPGHPRRAGVNSLGVGGTNAHTVLEEAPQRLPSDDSDWPFHLLTLSARTKGALDQASENLADWLEGAGVDAKLADVAFTLKEGRHCFDRRRIVVAETAKEAAGLLRKKHPRRVFSHTKVGDNPDPVFMFPGGGAQYAGMARDLYETEPVFREWMDKGLEILEPQIDFDIRALWLAELGREKAANARLQAPSVQLPLIMICEYALAQLWISWGVSPKALIGHSMGENTAAAVSGVMSFGDCIGLVLLRGRLFETVEKGGMLSVPMSEDELQACLGDGLDIASVNAPDLCVVSGKQADLDAFEATLAEDGIEARRIQIDIAAHSRLLEPILGDFGDYLRAIDLHAPQIPFVSNRTGDWITEAEATDPDYWVRHLRGTIHFRAGLSTLASDPNRIYIEVGPGVAMTAFASQHDTITANQVIGTLRHPEDPVADDVYFMAMLGRVWATGADFNWSEIWGSERRHRLVMPTYPFQHERYFIEPVQATAATTEDIWLSRLEDRDDWVWKPVWKPAYVEADVVEACGADKPETWLIFEDDTGLGAALSARLRGAGHDVITAVPGDTFAKSEPDRFELAVERGQDSFDSLLDVLAADDRMPTRLVHCWLVTAKETARPGSSFFHRLQEQGFWSLFHFARAWADVDGGDLAMTVVTSEAASVAGEALKYPEKVTVSGPARVLPREFPGITCRTLDIPSQAPHLRSPVIEPLLEEVLAKPANSIAAYRDGRRYLQTWRPASLPAADSVEIKPDQVVLVTGGLGGIGLSLAETLVRDKRAKVAILTRQGLPPRAEWDRFARMASATDRLAGRLRRLLEIDPDGTHVHVVKADVANLEDVELAKADIENTLGPVSGVIHAAGTISDTPILGKEPQEIDAVLSPKIYGNQVLNQVFPDGTLSWMVLFSSSSTVTAPIGQADYVAANEYLNAYAEAQIGSKTRVQAINWGPWAEVGMAFEAINTPDQEMQPTGTLVSQPLLDMETLDPDGNVTYLGRWTTAEQWVLDEHRTRDGDALLPGTGHIELAAQALAASGERRGFEIHGLTFLSPLKAPDDTAVSVRVTLAQDADGGHALTVASAVEGEQFQDRSEARLVRLCRGPQAIDIPAIAARMGLPSTAKGGQTVQTSQTAHLNFGPRWQVVRSMRFGKNEALASLEAPINDEGYRLHPGVMDLATGFGLPLVDGYASDQLWVPLTYERLRVFGTLPAKVVSWVQSDPQNSADWDQARFDVTIADETGKVLVEIEGFVVHRLKQGIEFAKQAPKQEASERVLSLAEERLRHSVEQGIPPADGAQMFLRALGSAHSQVVISSLHLPDMISQVETDAAALPVANAGFERPELDSAFVAPENDVERQLAAFWTELLGIAEIGVEDNFFELGGHSLIAVRLFAKVKAVFSVNFPISVLFKAPTIRTCADLIIARIGDAGQTSADDDAAASKGAQFQYLIPMHDGDTPHRTPFFMVAGMFGNVLNLRHLGHLIGADRPFYGLQARGLLGGEAPHNDLADAARDYIDEIRQIQPRGPYMVGGFSGGGLTAYEIARQLRAEGEEISVLVLLDTPQPRAEELTTADRIRIKLLKIRESGLSSPLIWMKNRVQWEIEKRRVVEFETSEIEFHNEAVRAGFMEAISTYEVAPWDGPMTLLRPPLSLRYKVGDGRYVNEQRAYVDPNNGWDMYVPSLQVIEVPGDHDSMVLEPNVRVLVARLRQLLDEAERQNRPPILLRAAE